MAPENFRSPSSGGILSLKIYDTFLVSLLSRTAALWHVNVERRLKRKISVKDGNHNLKDDFPIGCISFPGRKGQGKKRLLMR